MCWLRAITRHFSSLVSSFLKNGVVDRTKAQACYCCCWDFQKGITAAVDGHVPCSHPTQASPSAFHTYWVQSFHWLSCASPVKCPRMGSRTFSIACLPLNHGIAMDQLWQLMRAFGKSWVFSGIQCKLNISLDIRRILYVLTKSLQSWSLSISLT